MYCPYCGIELSDTARFCKNCGKNVGENANDFNEQTIWKQKQESEQKLVENASRGVKGNIVENISDKIVEAVGNTEVKRLNSEQFIIVFSKYILENCDDMELLQALMKTTKTINFGRNICVGDFEYHTYKANYWIKNLKTNQIWQLKKGLLFNIDLAEFKKKASYIIDQKIKNGITVNLNEVNHVSSGNPSIKWMMMFAIIPNLLLILANVGYNVIFYADDITEMDAINQSSNWFWVMCMMSIIFKIYFIMRDQREFKIRNISTKWWNWFGVLCSPIFIFGRGNFSKYTIYAMLLWGISGIINMTFL